MAQSFCLINEFYSGFSFRGILCVCALAALLAKYLYAKCGADFECSFQTVQLMRMGMKERHKERKRVVGRGGREDCIGSICKL